MILLWLDLRTNFKEDTLCYFHLHVEIPKPLKIVQYNLPLEPCGSLLGSTPIAPHPFRFSYSVYPVARVLSRSDMIVHPSPEGLGK